VVDAMIRYVVVAEHLGRLLAELDPAGVEVPVPRAADAAGAVTAILG
jgi:hypothetical protein